MSPPVFLQELGVVCALGHGKAEVWRRASRGDQSGLVHDGPFPLGRTRGDGLPIPAALRAHDSRNNRLLLQATEQIRAAIETARSKLGSHRIGVVIGTSTSGIEEGLQALRPGSVAEDFEYQRQEIGSPAVFLASALELTGPAYVVSTACTSSARVFASARRLMRLGLADAVLVGGADSLATLTVAGFHSLESVSRKPCNPMSLNRDGLTIGDGAAVFLLGKEPSPIALVGVGSCSDAHHMSAPDPQGAGATRAMRAALEDAGLEPRDVDALNLHGTATRLNDAMEAQALCTVFGASATQPFSSSTKPMTGHALGAAGAIELALSWLALSPLNEAHHLLPHLWDGVADPRLPALRLAELDQRAPVRTMMSNSFAFGGNNVTLIIKRA